MWSRGRSLNDFRSVLKVVCGVQSQKIHNLPGQTSVWLSFSEFPLTPELLNRLSSSAPGKLPPEPPGPGDFTQLLQLHIVILSQVITLLREKFLLRGRWPDPP